MSLIDDALKRAREQGRGAPAAGDAAPPAEPGAKQAAARDPWAYAPLPDDRTGGRVLAVAGVAILVAAAGIGGYFALRRGDRAGSSRRETAASAASPLAAARTPPASTPLATVFVPPPGRPRTSAAGSAAVGAPRETAAGVPAAAGPAPTPASVASAPAISAMAPAPARAPALSRAPSSVSAATVPPPRPPAESAPLASGSPRMSSAPVWRTEVAVPPPSVPAASAPSAEMSAPPSASQPAPPRPRGSASSSAPAARPHVGTYVAPNGGKIELGGIVYSETSPVALINGRVVPQGAIVEGLTVVSIEENRVELRGDGVHVFLSLK